MSLKNTNNKIPPPKIYAYVFRKSTQECPFCGTYTKRETFVAKKKRIITTELTICPKCKKRFSTYNLYCGNKNVIVCLNPEEVQNIIQEIEKKSAEKKIIREEENERILLKKDEISDLIYPELEALNKSTADLFAKYWPKTKLSFVELEALISAYIVKKDGGQYGLIFVSKNKNVKTKISTFAFSIIGSEDWLAKKLVASKIADYDYYYITDKLYDIKKTIILNESAYNNRIAALRYYGVDHWKPKHSRPTDTENSRENLYHIAQDKVTSVYVFFHLNNSCVRNNHSIESVTAETINVKNDQPVKVNVFYCRKCDKYFINFEALQSYFTRGIYPALQYTFNTVDTGTLKDASELMLYGYNVREGNLTQLERRRILEWIIDSGLLSKAEIIRDLQFKVRYNGSKAGNERARQKWLDDIQYVSRYVENNSRSIQARFIFK